MIHDEAIDVLVDVLTSGTVDLERRRAAEEHAITCRQCWGTVRLIHALTVGEEESDRRYGCAVAREHLYLIPGNDPESVRARHPDLVRHLRGCTSCRRDLAMLYRMERYADGEIEDLWGEVAGAMQRQLERVYELRSRLVVSAGAGLAHFSELAAGLVAEPFGIPAEAMRGTAPTRADVAVVPPGERVEITLGESGMVARIEVEPQGTSRVRLALSVEGTHRAVTVSLRQAGTTERIVAGQSTAAAESFVVRELVPGDYVLEVEEVEPQRRFRVRLHVRPADPQGTTPR